MASYDVVDFDQLDDDALAWVATGAPRDGRYEPPSWG
jgi:hypothetical protein